ncbi:hypothetical protein RP20_CCG006566 [Aedes albopictus]|nr:hypothetical protein RP20_CCG006566 [Aedes albopictus]
MESGAINDSQISASSAHDIGNVGPQHARIKDGYAQQAATGSREMCTYIVEKRAWNSFASNRPTSLPTPTTD